MPGYTRAPQAPSVPATVMVAVMGAAVVTRVATQAVLASRLLAAVAVQSNVAFVEPDRIAIIIIIIATTARMTAS